jgi:hypothetical protein
VATEPGEFLWRLAGSTPDETAGQNTIGQNTIGQNTIGQNTIGQNTIGQNAGQNVESL